jgi:hypothetical protein
MEQKTDNKDADTPVPPAMQEAETLMHEVRRLLVHSEGALSEEGVKDQAQTLERWLESYRRGLSAAQKLSQNSDSFLQQMRDRLKLSLEELQRLDDEGGTPATREQRQRMEDLTRTLGRIDHLIASLGDASFQTEPELVD